MYYLVDILAGINLILVFGSFFLAVGIILSLGGTKGYTLAKGWPYILVAVLIFAVIRVYEFFTEYATYTFPRYLKEGFLFFFSLSIFIGLLIQYLAIQEATSRKWK